MIFPRRTLGSTIDSVARQPLRQMEADYAHGTGHGVGHYLSVHESPPTLSKLSKTPLEVGMVLSIEPGYYVPDVFGIRLENIVEVVSTSENPELLTFSPLTLVPFESTLIERHQLTEEEIQWLRRYHANIWDTLHSRLSKEGLKWLEARKIS
jgi:Xaa-Pro aminopeptidase